MSNLVTVRPNGATPVDTSSPVGAAEHRMRLDEPTRAPRSGAVAASETELPSDQWQSPMIDAGQSGRVIDPLQDVLGCLTEIIGFGASQRQRQPDHQLADHHSLMLHQQELESLPGVVLNSFDVDGPVWLAVEALAATEPPAIDADLEIWVELSSDPDRRPIVRDSAQVTVDEIEKNRLTFARHARPEDFSPAVPHDAASGAWIGRLRLELRPDLVQRIERYVAGPWTAWAATERARRQTMAIHQRLREMARTVGADPSREIVWGMALSSCRHGGREFELPLFERAVEIELIERADAEVRVRPRFAAATVNLKAFDALAPETAGAVHERSDRLIEATEQGGELSPFTPIDLKQILAAAGAQPGPKSIRSLAASEDASPSEVGESVVASGRWVMSVRRRSERIALRDIDRLKHTFEHAPQSECCLSAGLGALLPQPAGGRHASMRRPLSSVVGGPIDIAPVAKPAVADRGDLFFPLPAGPEQVEIVRELSRSAGLVVQAEGAEERISALVNIVCHHLALGLRVLIVSRDENTLSLLHGRLPSSIRELTVSSTGSDRDVLRRAEALADRLQSIADATNLRDQVEQIGRLERDIISKRAQIGSLDDEIAEIVRRNLQLVGGLPELPFDVMDRLSADHDGYAWFTDRPMCLLSATAPLVAAVDRAREARLRLGERLKHIDDELPDVAALPEAAALLRLHEELRQNAETASEAGRDADLALDAVAMFGLDATTRLAADLDALASAHRAIASEPWLARLSPLAARKGEIPAEVDMVVSWARDASFQLSRSAEFSSRRVQAPVEAFTKREAIRIVERLSAGEKPFARFSRSRRGLKAAIDAITVDGIAPSTSADWQYVGRYLGWRGDLHSLGSRWTSLAGRVGATTVKLETAPPFNDLERIVKGVEAAIMTAALAIRNVVDACRKLSMPDSEITPLLEDAARPAAFGAAIRSVLERVSGPLLELSRLGELFSAAGEIASSVQADVLSCIGDAEVAPRELEARWSGILATMQTISQAREDYELVRTACRMVTEAGAPDLAHRLRSEPAVRGTEEAVPLSDWMRAWNWAVLMRIESPDQRQLLQDLAAQRLRLEKRSLALFEAVIGARMTLSIAQNAGGASKQALRQFKDTMRKMAAACSGPSARRLRSAARTALDGWLEEVPCHITPAWRVAELLPARIGTFDLLIVDEGSRADLRELTGMLRARKVLVSDERRDTARNDIGGNDLGSDRIEPKAARRIPPALRRLLLPDASLRDLIEILFPNRIIELRAGTSGVATGTIAPSLLAETSSPFAIARPERPKPVRTVGPKLRVSQREQANATHTIEEEIATLARYLSLARRSRVEPVVEPGAMTDGAAGDRRDNRDVSGSKSPEVRIFRRRQPRAANADVSLSAAKPEPSPLMLPPVMPDHAASASSVAAEPRAKADQPDAKSPPPIADGIVEPVVTAPAISAEPATQAKPSASSDEIKIHPGLVEMAFKAVESPSQSRRRPSRRVMAVAAVGLLAVVGAAVAWERASDWIQVSWSGTTPAVASPGESGPRKISSERIAPGGQQIAAADEGATVGRSVETPAPAPIPATAQAFLYHEDPQDPKGKRFPGKVTWSIEQSKGPRANASPTLKGEIEIENGLKATISLRRNVDLELPASHVMELSFNLPEQTAAGLASLRGIGVKSEEAERGTALATQMARVTPKLFMVALSANDVDVKRNMMLLKGKQWFDIPMVYENGNRALLSIEKGSDGERVFNDAFTGWGQ